HWGEHRIELYRRSEAQFGTTQIRGFDFHVGQFRAPPTPASHRIEVIGDASSAGFGIEGVGRGEGCPGGANAARWENMRIAYPQVLADFLDGELMAAVFTGKGVARNVWRLDPTPMTAIHERVLPFDPSSAFTSDVKQPDAIVVMLG